MMIGKFDSTTKFCPCCGKSYNAIRFYARANRIATEDGKFWNSRGWSTQIAYIHFNGKNQLGFRGADVCIVLPDFTPDSQPNAGWLETGKRLSRFWTLESYALHHDATSLIKLNTHKAALLLQSCIKKMSLPSLAIFEEAIDMVLPELKPDDFYPIDDEVVAKIWHLFPELSELDKLADAGEQLSARALEAFERGFNALNEDGITLPFEPAFVSGTTFLSLACALGSRFWHKEKAQDWLAWLVQRDEELAK